MSAPHVYVLVDTSKKGTEAIIQIYTTFAAARHAATKAKGSIDVKKVKVLEGEDASIDPAKNSDTPQSATKLKKANRPSAVKSEDAENKAAEDDTNADEADDKAEEEEAETSPAKRKTSAASKSKTSTKATSKSAVSTKANSNIDRKAIPEGKPDALKGLKLVFTGTFETMDRDTSKATAKLYGAQVITKLEDTDYIVLGTRPGTKKVETIAELGLETISEQEFFDMLENGVPAEKRKRMREKDAEDDGSTKKKSKR